ncbi:MAG: T9SS type A sorting domain-containing protein [Saprospiraceae bacterium]|nr:T9SS type A sorting domain-containing protein [Saprospiraceae bacterium]
MKWYRCLLPVVVWVSLQNVVFTQSGFSTSGIDISSEKGRISATVGQITHYQWVSNKGIINEGVQQPYEIFILTGVEEYSISLSLFPNPTLDDVILLIDNPGETLSYRLSSLDGKTLKDEDIHENETIIHLDNFMATVFLLTVFENNKIVKTFKIIKN